MKKIVFIIILGLLWTTVPVEAQRRPGHREQYEYSQGRPRLQYVIGHNAVLFDGKVIKGASPARFKVLRDGYARDDWKVYYMGKAIKGANSNSFKVLDNGYAKDSWDVYYHGSKIKGASSGSFKVLNGRYALDAWDVYFKGMKIKGASPGSFKVLRDGYACDAWNVYFNGDKIRVRHLSDSEFCVTDMPKTAETPIISVAKYRVVNPLVFIIY